MPIDVSKIKNLLGDRILIRPLARPEKRGSLMLPMSALKEKGKQSDLWFGVIENLGRDSRYPDAYGLKPGDIVGVEFIGRQCETLVGTDGEEHCWVAEEFLAVKDDGRVAAFRDGMPFDKAKTGMIPLGSYTIVRPDVEEDMRGGLHIPHNAREQQKLGECLGVSIGGLSFDEIVSLHVTVGDRVIFGRFSGSWAKLDEDLLLMKQEDVVAVLETEKETANV